MLIAKTLSFYKREDVRDEIIRQAGNKEIGIRYSEKGFGKRPDVLKYPQDILESAKNGATSFHCSEELWSNPMVLSTEMKKNEIEELRIGWDLILDIDCPVWDFSKLIAHLFVKSLEDHDIRSISCKFSGNKGFHIAVPWEAFPERIANKDTKNLFPEAPKKIAEYLLDFISKKYIRVSGSQILFDGREYAIAELSSLFSKSIGDLVIKKCNRCGQKIADHESKYEFQCVKGHFSMKSENEEEICPKCGLLMNKYPASKYLCSCREKAEIRETFNPLSIVQVDTILLAPRHLYRMPYSLHEKSLLASIPVEPGKILDFKKEMAGPEGVRVNRSFLDRRAAVRGEASRLLVAAYDFSPGILKMESEEGIKSDKEFEVPEEAIPESCFPPCIIRGLQGLDDGKKRFLFILTNFLYSCGWGAEQVEQRVLEWNKMNSEPLRDSYIVGHLSHAKKQKKKMLPPNCAASGYYKDLGLCKQEDIADHGRIKNPVQFAKSCFKLARKGKRKKQGKKEKKKEISKEQPQQNL